MYTWRERKHVDFTNLLKKTLKVYIEVIITMEDIPIRQGVVNQPYFEMGIESNKRRNIQWKNQGVSYIKTGIDDYG